MMTFNNGHLLSQLSGKSLLEVDLSTLSYIGKAAKEARVLVVRTDLGIRGFEDLRREGEPFLFVTSGVGGSNNVQTTLLKEAFELNIRISTGLQRQRATGGPRKGGRLTVTSHPRAIYRAYWKADMECRSSASRREARRT